MKTRLHYAELIGPVSDVATRYGPYSKSQSGHDLFAIFLLGENAGYFVEFGAIDGVHNSNTHLMESQLNWSGIVCEPSRRWHDVIKHNRSCHIETRCVYSETGKVLEFGDTGRWRGGNTLAEFKESGTRPREFSDVYYVETISLSEMFAAFEAPEIIDFISIDTEGSEYKILNAFDFSRRFRLIVVEHGFEPEKRAAIKELMLSKDYKFLDVDPRFSSGDDWYADQSVYNKYIRLLT